MVRDPALLTVVGQRYLLPLGLSTIDLSTIPRGGSGLDQLTFRQDNHRKGVPWATLAGVSVPWPQKRDSLKPLRAGELGHVERFLCFSLAAPRQVPH